MHTSTSAEHAVPSGFSTTVHAPVAGSHAEGAWHASTGPHVTALPPHTPAVHVSDVVQRLPSSQPVPSASGG